MIEEHQERAQPIAETLDLSQDIPQLPDIIIRRFGDAAVEFNESLTSWWNKNRMRLIESHETFTVPINQATEDVSTLKVESENAFAAIEEERIARIFEDGVLASAITVVEVGYQAADAVLSASITAESTARITADSALATQISTVEADYLAADALLSAAITTEATARSNGDSALASLITSLDAAYQAADAVLQANINSEASTRASADSAEASTRSSADTALQNNINTVSASVTTEATARSTADAALASSITTVTANYQSADASLSASITSEAIVRAAADNAIHARWGVALDVNGHIVGRVNLDGSNQSSSFLVAVDKFQLVNGNGTVTMMDIRAGGAIVLGADAQSDNFSSGSSGWRLERNSGSIEVNDGLFRAGLRIGTNSTTPGYAGDTATGMAVEKGTYAMFISRADVFSLSLNRNGGDGAVAIFHKGASQVGAIQVTNTNTSYITTSDRRVKANIVDAPDAGGIIDALVVREYEFIAAMGVRRLGFIAQEVWEVYPEAVMTGDWGMNPYAEGAMLWGIDHSLLVPPIVKAIQDLRVRVAALEAA